MRSRRYVIAFYIVVLAVALAGSTTAAAGWLGVPWYIAVVPVAAVELGGVVLMMHAHERRELGERAFAARALSAVVAGMAVAVNGLGHTHRGQSAFFAGMSALGYAVYLLISAARRRDALRAAGMLPPAAPAYGLAQWIRHPRLTSRARRLALADPSLGLYGSLDAASAQIRAERREAAIADALDRIIRKAAGPVMADIAVHTYDPAEIASRLAASADYDGYARLIGAALTPAKLAGAQQPSGDDLMAVADATAPTIEDQVGAAIERPSGAARVAAHRVFRYRPRPSRAGLSRPRRLGRPQPAIHVTVLAADRSPRSATSSGTAGRSHTARKTTRRSTTAERVAAALARTPNATQADIAHKLGLGVRTVRRYWPKQPTVNGYDHHKEG